MKRLIAAATFTAVALLGLEVRGQDAPTRTTPTNPIYNPLTTGPNAVRPRAQPPPITPSFAVPAPILDAGPAPARPSTYDPLAPIDHQAGAIDHGGGDAGTR